MVEFKKENLTLKDACETFTRSKWKSKLTHKLEKVAINMHYATPVLRLRSFMSRFMLVALSS